jgi:branched-chain amino acid transport system ATP-binding protein
MTALLCTEGLTAGYGEIAVVNDLQLEIFEGEVVGLIGANGAGKTTILKTLIGILPAIAGTISFAAGDITCAPPRDRVRRGLSLVPEGRELFWDMSVTENLEVAGLAVGKDSSRIDELTEFSFRLFPRLRERFQQIAGTMSGGEQQMLAIARALMIEPKLLMLDEPSAGLAPSIVTLVMEQIGQIRKLGTTVLLVEQDVTLALKLCDRVYVLDRGRVVAAGKSGEVTKGETLIQAFLGSAVSS